MEFTPLPPEFASRFTAPVRARGFEAFERGEVTGLERRDGSVTAEVEGARRYLVELLLDEPDAVGSCTCPAFERLGPCKHMWAVAVAAADAATDAATDAARAAGEFEELEDAVPGSLAWQRRLEALGQRESPELPDPRALLEARRLRYEYELDVEASLRRGVPQLVTKVRRLRKDGTWGKAADHRPSWRGAGPRPEGVDRRIMLLLGALPEDDEQAYYSIPYATDSFPVSATKGEELFPLLAETRRVSWRSEDATGPLAWDAGEPWEFELAMEPETRDGVECLVLRGHLVRGDQRIGVEEPMAVFETGVLLLDGALARYDARDAPDWIAELRRAGPIVVPRAQEEDLHRRMANLPSRAWAGEVPWRVAGGVEPVPHLFVHAADAWRESRLGCTLAFDYGADRRVRAHETQRVLESASGAPPIERDVRAEFAAMEFFERLGGSLTQRDMSGAGNASLPERHFGSFVRELVQAGWIVEAKGKAIRAPGASRVSVESGIDWFELEGGIEFGDQFAPLPAILAAARAGRTDVRLDDGSHGLLPEDWLESWGLLDVAGKASGDTIRFAKNQGWLLDALLRQRDDVNVDDGFEEYRRRLASFDRIEPQQEPDGFRGELRPYQREGLGWFAFLRQLGLGGCLADDMGLGKTVQVLALLEQRRLERAARGMGPRPTLVVAPRSLVFNWIAEAKRFAPQLALLDYTGADRRDHWDELLSADVVLTTYGTLRRDAAELSEVEFDYLVLDEATAIKNASSQSAKSARLLRARHRLALSGTPVENHLGELWSLFEFLNPGMLGRSRMFGAFTAKTGREGDFKELAKALRPFFLRRTKDEVLDDLPPKTEQIVMCDLGVDERARYDEVRDHFRAQLLGNRAPDEDLGRMKIQVLEALLRLRQCACHPSLMDPSRIDDDSAKLNELLPRIEELVDEGHKVLVFSQFTTFLRVVRARFEERGITYEYLDGRTRKRKEKVERFQSDPDCPVFLISLKAGGHGLNLTKADYVFLLDPWWNPAIESQAIDRAHRIGQARPVFAYRLIARGTVEEKVLELQDSKRELAEALLSQGSTVLRDLTRQDLELLLS
ncbi:MAG: DEAD/DEAH box helicase [Planctomycetota bacterium]